MVFKVIEDTIHLSQIYQRQLSAHTSTRSIENDFWIHYYSCICIFNEKILHPKQIVNWVNFTFNYILLKTENLRFDLPILSQNTKRFPIQYIYKVETLEQTNLKYCIKKP